MIPLSLILEVSNQLDKISLLKELLSLQDGFLKLTSVCKKSVPGKREWLGLSFDPIETERIILIPEKERFVSQLFTEVTPDSYLEDFNEVVNFLGDQLGERGLYAKFYGAVPVQNTEMGERYLFREVYDYEWYHIQPTATGLTGSVWYKALSPLFWIWIEELNEWYDVWLRLESKLWFSSQEKYTKDFTPVEVQANFKGFLQYLQHFFERNLIYCRQVMIDPDEDAENGKIAEELKPILLKLLQGKIEEIEILW